MDSHLSYYSTSFAITVKESLNSKNLRYYSTDIRKNNDSQMDKDLLLPKYLQDSS